MELPRETVIEELMEDVQKVTIGEVQGGKAGKERRKRVEFEAGAGEEERREE